MLGVAWNSLTPAASRNAVCVIAFHHSRRLGKVAHVSELQTRQEAANALKVSVVTVDRLIKNGVLPAVRIGRAVRINPVQVEAFIEAQSTV